MTATTALLAATPAFAGPVVLKPIVDARLRYEHVEQRGTTPAAEAATMRLRAGAEAKSGPIAVLVEGEGTLAISDGYNSGLNGKPGPIIADPENIELNRAQVQFTGLPKTVVTVGRQRINLDDQRFVGAVGWRQNEQTFDAARIEWTGIKGVRADVTYSWSVRTIWGMDGASARPASISGDNVFATLGYKEKTWGVTMFAYLVDQDEAAVQAFRLSSQTYGLRANTAVPLGKAKLGLLASYARQTPYGRNPNTYAANYWLGEAALDVSGFKLTGGYEVLGADSGAALTSFQTPLATLHKFNGWADKFLTTPPNGLRDLYLGLGYGKRKLAGQLFWHSYTSDRLGLDYGREWNAQISWKATKRLGLLAKYARYDRDGTADFTGDATTDKLWLQIEYVL